MEIFHKAIVFVLIILIMVIPNTYAQQANNTKSDYYEESGFRLTSNPVICLTAPSDPQFPQLGSKTLGMVDADIAEWKNMLTLGSTLLSPSGQIQLMQITGSKVSDSCNITIDFLPKPLTGVTSDNSEPVGHTQYDFTNHKAHIVIYYDAIEFQSHTVNCAGYENGTIVCDENEPVGVIGTRTYITSSYTDNLAPDYQLLWTLKHELGHAFGLGHYILSDAENEQYFGGKIDAPSIMLPYEPSGKVFQSAVTTLDVEHLKSLYPTTRFSSPILPQVSPVTPTPQPEQSNQQNTSPQIQIPSWIKNNAKWWSDGSIGDGDFIKGIQYLIQQKIITLPQTQTSSSKSNTIPSWIKNNAKWWSDGSIGDGDFIKGIQYLVQTGVIKVS